MAPLFGSSARVILHVDMDAFFASVELRRRPDLAGQPVAVGGTGRRGVIAAASYEARRFGVFSAMPTATALRRCPHLVVLAGDHDLYAAVSADVRSIFESFTPLIEPLALDEAFLDVSGAQRLLGDGRTIAAMIRTAISQQLALSCAVGVAANKFLAKMASKAAKPRPTAAGVVEGPGVFEVRPGTELAFLHPQPVTALWGVGPATHARLARLGVVTIGDLAAMPLPAVIGVLGPASGRHLHELAWARDRRPVVVERTAKSIGHEETYAVDRRTTGEIRSELVRLADGVARRLRAAGVAGRTITLKVRYSDFNTVSRSVTVEHPIDSAHALLGAVLPLADEVHPEQGVRLLGISAGHLSEPATQLELDVSAPAAGVGQRQTGAQQEWRVAEEAIDRIRHRFGETSIGAASAISGRGLRVVQPGVQPWGPSTAPPSGG